MRFGQFDRVSISMNEPHIRINGEAAWVVGMEKIELLRKDGKRISFDAFVTNVFENKGGQWLLVAHRKQQPPGRFWCGTAAQNDRPASRRGRSRANTRRCLSRNTGRERKEPCRRLLQGTQRFRRCKDHVNTSGIDKHSVAPRGNLDHQLGRVNANNMSSRSASGQFRQAVPVSASA
jgi:hypothetical protein